MRSRLEFPASTWRSPYGHATISSPLWRACNHPAFPHRLKQSPERAVRVRLVRCTECTNGAREIAQMRYTKDTAQCSQSLCPQMRARATKWPGKHPSSPPSSHLFPPNVCTAPSTSAFYAATPCALTAPHGHLRGAHIQQCAQRGSRGYVTWHFITS